MNNQSQPKGYMGAPYIANIYGQQQQQVNQQSKDLFQTLAKEFQYQIVKAPNEYTQSAIVMLKNFQIRIDQNYNVGIPPTCTLNNAPYDYTKFYQWNNNSNHLSLVHAIQDQLELQLKILSNPIIKNYSEFINSFHIDENVNRIKNMPLSQILPLIQPSEYQQWINSDEKQQTLRAQLSQTQELKNLKDQILFYAQQNEIVADLIEANDKDIKTKIERLLNRNRLLEDEKDNYIQLQNRSRALSERFQDSKVNTLFQQICEKYDEISDKLLESETNGDYEDQANQYFQSRRKYQKTLALSEKFRQMKQI